MVQLLYVKIKINKLSAFLKQKNENLLLTNKHVKVL